MNSIRLRQRRYLNNRIEQGYCVIKRWIRPMLGFKSIVFACAILGEFVTIYMSRKAQANYACRWSGWLLARLWPFLAGGLRVQRRRSERCGRLVCPRQETRPCQICPPASPRSF
ncbi:DDE-type integrase/transposase/recombinase [Microvirga sp. BT689]|nr:DDE-type integrase/transposase/recombinase [Microvirga arvi]